MPRPNAPETSHVSTSEWQSFETRMRRRRVERCVVRAEGALAAGDEAGAATALAEARELSPLDTPDLETLRMRVSAAGAGVPVDLSSIDAADVDPAPETGRTGRLRTVAAALVVLGLAAVGAVLTMDIYRTSEAAPVSTSVPAPSVPAPSRTIAEPPAPALTVPAIPVDTQAEADRRAADIIPASAPVAPPASAGSEPGPVRVAYTPPPTVGAAGGDNLPAIVGSAPSIAVAPPEPPPAAPPEILVAPLDTAGAPAASIAGTPPAPAPPAPEPVEPRIRAVLSSYEAAFGSLDAAAVHRVWPGVDERSLARAFDGLAAQAVSLGDCAISVRGDTATAQCNGSTTWAPKVGGGSRTEARRWEFALHNAGANWLIVRADVR